MVTPSASHGTAASENSSTLKPNSASLHSSQPHVTPLTNCFSFHGTSPHSDNLHVTGSTGFFKFIFCLLQGQNIPAKLTKGNMTPITMPMNQPFATASRPFLFHMSLEAATSQKLHNPGKRTSMKVIFWVFFFKAVYLNGENKTMVINTIIIKSDEC